MLSVALFKWHYVVGFTGTVTDQLQCASCIICLPHFHEAQVENTCKRRGLEQTPEAPQKAQQTKLIHAAVINC